MLQKFKEIMYINVHTHTSSGKAIEIVNLDDLYTTDFPSKFSVGIHPWYCNVENLSEQLQLVEQLIKHDNCVAIGECGLDTKIQIDKEHQKQVFEIHIEWAKTYNKPLIIHCVGAFDDLIALRKKHHQEIPFILHGFSKNHQLATALVNKNIHLSFGKQLLNNPKVQRSLATIPESTFFLETDAAELSIEEVYACASGIKGKDVKDIVLDNYNKIF